MSWASKTIRKARKTVGGLFAKPPSVGGDARRAEEAANRETDQRIAEVRSAFGEGGTPAAQASRAAIDSALASREADIQGAGDQAASDQYGQDLRTIGDRMYAQGLQGGSADLSARRAALESFVKGRQQALAKARASTQQARTALTNQRLGLEQQVAMGTKAAPDWTNTAALRNQQIGSAMQTANQEVVGGLIRSTGDLYGYNREEVAAGREPITSPARGWSLSGI